MMEWARSTRLPHPEMHYFPHPESLTEKRGE
jgi:hypothetical protein